MAGYTRQSVADIIANAVIKAAPVNAEFNAIRDAFNNSTGHKHDGTSSEGTYVPLIADLDANNKVVVDTTNNRIGIFTEVSGSAVEQLRIQDGAIVPVTDDDIDLGAAGTEFKDLYIDGIGYIDSVVITGGTIDGTIIGATTPAAADFTTMDTTGNASVGGTFGVTGTSTFTGAISAGSLTTTGNSTHATVDINGGAIDGTIIGASSAAAGSFTTVSTSGQATLATADINGGTIDGSVIGGATPQAVTGTTITANTGFSGALTGSVTGNVTGNLTGDVTGDVTGDLTGNVTAASGTSSFTDVTINGTLNMNAGTTATITNLTAPSNDLDAATKKYVDDEVAALVDSAPGTLDTLNELAAALGDDADFANTITTSIATKLPLAGGTMTGAIAMGTSKITGLGDPTANQDAATKAYSDTQDATKLNLSGGTMTGAIDMGANKITTTYTPTNNADLTTKTYVDGILGSGTSASASAAAAATSETNAATSETNAGNSATAAAASYDDFDDRYLGSKSSEPSVDNDGDALLTGALYWDTTNNQLKIYTGSTWSNAAFTLGDALTSVVEDTTPQLGGNLDSNGNDILFGDNDKAIFGAGSDLSIYHDGSASYIHDNGVGSLKVRADQLRIESADGSETLAVFNQNSDVFLRHDNTTRLTTTSTGVDITGTLTSDGLTVAQGSGANILLESTTTGATTGDIFGEIEFKTNDSNSAGVKGKIDSYSEGAVGNGALRLFTGDTTGLYQRMNIASTGDISFYEDTGTTPKFFWDASAESLGIGTSSVNGALHVQANPTAEFSLWGGGGSYGRSKFNIQSVDDGTSVGKFQITTESTVPSNPELVTITNAGNVGIGEASPSVSLDINATDAVQMPLGTDAQRPSSPANGMIRYSTTSGSFEGYQAGAWAAIGGGGDVGAPTLSGSSSANEFSNTTVTITDYDSALIYRVSVTGGSYTRSGGTITWTLPGVTTDTIHYMTVNAIDNGVTSPDAEWDIDVLNVPLTGDTGIQITDFSSNTSNTGWSV
jgi:hypothetical protein